MRLLRTFALACIAASASGPASAADEVRAELDACRSLADDAERLACYDRAAARILTQPTAPAPAPASAAAATAPSGAPATAEDNFGRERAQAAEEAKRRSEAARAAGELNAAVAGIATRVDGLLTITLDNGQVWRQVRPDSMFRLKVGDRVKIQPGSMKSYILSGPTNKSTRVSRVQ